MLDSALNRLAAIGAGIGLLVALVTLSSDAAKPLGVWYRPILGVGFILLVGGAAVIVFDLGRRLIGHFRPRPELSINVQEVQWRNWHEYALIAMIRVRIANNAAYRKQLVGTGLGVTPPTHSPGNAAIHNNRDVRQLVEALRQQHQMVLTHRWLEPGDSVSGWFIDSVGDPAAGTPTLRISVYDEIDSEYATIVPAKGRVVSVQ